MIFRIVSKAAVAGILFANAVSVLASDTVGRTPLVNGPDLQFPSFGRVVAVFTMVGVIALVAIVALRKIKPWLLKRGLGLPVTSKIALIAQQKLSRTLNVYLVDAEQQRFMIVQSSNSVVVTRVDGANESVDSVSTENAG